MLHLYATSTLGPVPVRLFSVHVVPAGGSTTDIVDRKYMACLSTQTEARMGPLER